MIATCFFCQNLLSDYIEGILPSSRHEDIRKHLESCPQCTGLLTDLNSTLDLTKNIKPPLLSPDFVLRLEQASESVHPAFLYRRKFLKKFLYLSIPILLLLIGFFAFPPLFPWLSRLRAGENSADFVRYFPMLQGADEILEEQATWFSRQESFTGSLWEEGGLSPEDFEKAFQKKGGER